MTVELRQKFTGYFGRLEEKRRHGWVVFYKTEVDAEVGQDETHDCHSFRLPRQLADVHTPALLCTECLHLCT